MSLVLVEAGIESVGPIAYAGIIRILSLSYFAWEISIRLHEINTGRIKEFYEIL